MSNIVVGVADCQVTNDPDRELVTYALGSCIGLAVWDPVSKVGGLLHYMLPESALDPNKATQNPYMFGDSGVPALVRRCCEIGAMKTRMIVWAAGGAQVMDEKGVFNIGKRNYLALRKILWKAGILLSAEDIGGSSSRTVRLDVSNGRFWIRGPGQPEQELRPTRAMRGGMTECRFTS